MTEYSKHKPSSTFVNKVTDKGGDENVRYKLGKRQNIKANYKLGKMPRGTGSVGSANKQTKGIGKA